jgi:hypothetical protein
MNKFITEDELRGWKKWLYGYEPDPIEGIYGSWVAKLGKSNSQLQRILIDIIDKYKLDTRFFEDASEFVKLSITKQPALLNGSVDNYIGLDIFNIYFKYQQKATKPNKPTDRSLIFYRQALVYPTTKDEETIYLHLATQVPLKHNLQALDYTFGREGIDWFIVKSI